MTNCSVTSIVFKITFQAFTYGAQPPAISSFFTFGALTQPAAGSTASAAPAADAPLFSFASLGPVTPATPSTAFSFGVAAAAPAVGGLFGSAPATAPAAPAPTMSFSLGNASLFGAVSATASAQGTSGA